ncbi:MAG: S49 family peptidase [Granulosicoccaceae bacterium]
MSEENRTRTSSRSESWERQTIKELANGALVEQRKTRRWGLFFKFLMVAYIGFVTLMAFRQHLFPDTTVTEDHTALLVLSGAIAADGDGISSRAVLPSLKDAFEEESAKAVVLRINSPGGSPVQSGIIYDEIRRLRAEYPDKKLYAVVQDVAASGGYYIASAADEIYVDKASIVGSIGVVTNGFGFVGTMEKLGVERRMITAGENKGMLDPFSPSRETDVVHMRTLVADIHEQFKTVVREGRGDRLKEDEDTFSGKFWTGAQAIELGLADGTGDEYYVAREIVGAEELREYGPKKSLLDQIASQVGVSFYQAVKADLLGSGTFFQ